VDQTGTGSCEGWSLEIGDTIRCSVARNLEWRWRVSSNLFYTGTFESRDDAMDEDVGRRMLRDGRTHENSADLNLAKVGVEGSNPSARSKSQELDGFVLLPRRS
jgi:hypothetical protein